MRSLEKNVYLQKMLLLAFIVGKNAFIFNDFSERNFSHSLNRDDGSVMNFLIYNHQFIKDSKSFTAEMMKINEN